MDLLISARLPFSDSRTTAGLADAAAKIISRGKVSLMLKQYGDMIRAADVKKAEQWESQSDLSKFEQAPINMHKLQALIDYQKLTPLYRQRQGASSQTTIYGECSCGKGPQSDCYKTATE